MRILRLIGGEIRSHFEFFIGWIPGAAGTLVRRSYWLRRLAALGTRATIGQGALIFGARSIRIGDEFTCWRLCTLAADDDGQVVIGDHVSFNSNVYVNACGGHIAIGNDVMIGPNVVLRSNDHMTTSRDRPMRLQGHVQGRIDIEDDVWLAANVTVVGGVRIGRGAVVAANAVVTRDVDEHTIVGGVPARPMSVRGAAPGA